MTQMAVVSYDVYSRRLCWLRFQLVWAKDDWVVVVDGLVLHWNGLGLNCLFFSISVFLARMFSANRMKIMNHKY